MQGFVLVGAIGGRHDEGDAPCASANFSLAIDDRANSGRDITVYVCQSRTRNRQTTADVKFLHPDGRIFTLWI
jgi:hypothetical protein